MFSYHHWDEEEEFENPWNLYFVSMYDMFTNDPIEAPWPVFSTGFDEAMDTYQILCKMAVNK